MQAFCTPQQEWVAVFMVWVFWSSFLILLYVYVGYPMLLACLRRSRDEIPQGDGGAPSYDVVMASHQEGPRVLEKITEILLQEGDHQLNRILVGLDGPHPTFPSIEGLTLADGRPLFLYREADGLPEVFPEQGCIIIEFKNRGGKPACLNRLLEFAQSEVVVFFDVRQRLGENCVTNLLTHFAHPAIHVVSGNLEWEASSSITATGEGMGIYWRYEKWIRKQESSRGCVPGATGACYALRRSQFLSIPTDTLDDDVLIPLQACAKTGECLFESSARIYDVPSSTAQQEGLRKRRTIAGIYQILFRHVSWIMPGGHPFWFSILSHKVLRLAGPFLLLGLLVSNVCLVECMFYRALLLGHGAFYLFAILAPTLRGIPLVGSLSSGAHSFVLLNWTCLLALTDSLSGRFSNGWDRAYVSEAP